MRSMKLSGEPNYTKNISKGGKIIIRLMGVGVAKTLVRTSQTLPQGLTKGLSLRL